jgi:hypothetical protein
VFPSDLKSEGYGLPIVDFSLTEGAAKEYNSKCARELDKLKAYDRITSVEGETGQPSFLKEKIEKTIGKIQVMILRGCPEKCSDMHLEPSYPAFDPHPVLT